MAMYYSDTLTYQYVPKEWEERKSNRRGDLIINHSAWKVVHLETIGHVSHSCAVLVGVSDDYHLVSPLDEGHGQTPNVGLQKEREGGGYICMCELCVCM
jgi:hypothetical protein